MSTRSFFLGDWHPWLRDPIDPLRALLLAGAHHYTGIGIVSFALGVALGGLWEIVEWGSDNTLGSSLQLGNDDTIGDLIADSLGSLCGAALLVAWARWGWGSVRRIPGENRAEEAEAG